MVTFLGNEIRAVLFDLDGTLLDSTGLWGQIDEDFFARRGETVPEGYGRKMAQLGLEKAAVYTKEHYFPNENAGDIYKEWLDASLSAYANELPLKEGALEFVRFLSSHGIKMGLVTASAEHFHHPALERLGVWPYLSCYVDPAHCPSGKQDAAMHELAASKLGVKPCDVLVIEDSLRPMKAAKEAGFLVLGLYDSCTTSDIEEAKNRCHAFANNWAEAVRFLKD